MLAVPDNTLHLLTVIAFAALFSLSMFVKEKWLHPSQPVVAAWIICLALIVLFQLVALNN